MTRTRRVIRVVGPWRVSVSLVCGVVLTVLVAWSAALNPWDLWGPDHERSLRYRAMAIDEREVELVFVSTRVCSVFVFTQRESVDLFRHVLQTELAEEWVEMTPEQVPGWFGGVAQAERDQPGIPFDTVNELGYGWPVVTMIARQTRGGANHRLWRQAWNASVNWSAPINTTGRAVPLGVHVPGFVQSFTMIGIGVYLILSFVPAASGLRRRLTNRCHPCGYTLDGLTADTCPECGWAIKGRRRSTPSDSAGAGPPPPSATGEESGRASADVSVTGS